MPVNGLYCTNNTENEESYIITVLLAVKVARQNTLTGENVVEMQPEINSKLKS